MNDSMMCQTVSLVHVLYTYASKGLMSVRRSLTLLPILKLEGGYILEMCTVRAAYWVRPGRVGLGRARPGRAGLGRAGLGRAVLDQNMTAL